MLIFLRPFRIKGVFFMITTTKKIVGTACFAALSFVVSFLEFPIFPSAGFLQLDFSLVFILLSGFIFGPTSAVATSFVKELLRFLIGSGTGGVGEIANFCITLGYVLVPTIVYLYRKGIKTVIFTISIGCIIQVMASLLVNRYVNFPLFMGDKAKDMFQLLWGYVLAFNLIKSVSVAVITILLYKRTSKFIKSINAKKKLTDKNYYISRSERQTIEIAREYAKTLSLGDVILLSGDLGAGKTAFTKGLALGLNIKDKVTSPTYAYLNVYGENLYHYDCYRLENGEAAELLGLTDYFGGDNICVIEWSENIKEVLPQEVKRVTITKLGKNKRRIEL